MMDGEAATRRRHRIARNRFYQQCRVWHGYLSAVAFLALIFFAVTGLLLNHPDWFAGERETTRATMTLDRAAIRAAEASDDPPRALAEAVRARLRLTGAYSDGAVEEGRATIRTEGVRGTSDLTVDLSTGQTEVVSEKADAVTIVNELHRGTLSGPIWRTMIDIVAILVATLSIIGFVLFFTLKFRTRTSLTITAAGAASLILIFVLFVP